MSTRVVTPATILVGAFLLALIGGGLYTYITRADTPSRVPFTLALPSSFATGTTALSPSDYTIRSAREVEYVNDGAILAAIPEFQAGWKTLAFSLLANRAIASERVTRAITLDDTSLTSHFTLDGLSVATNYKVMPKAPNTRSLDNVAALVKQTVTLENTTDDAIVTDLAVTHIIPSDTFTHDGTTYTATEAPQSFKAYQKTASIPEYAKDVGYPEPEKAKAWERMEHTYTAGTRITWETADGRTAIYDWSDAAHLAHEVTVREEDGRTILTFSVTDITVPAHGKTEIDPNYALSNTAAYGTRFDGGADFDVLPSAIAIGDVNGDGKDDLVLGARYADNGGFSSSGSAYVFFSTLLDDMGTSTGNIKLLSTATNYNIRYDGGASFQYLTQGNNVAIGDVNSDGYGDLILGAAPADYNVTNSGSAWVIFSTLIDDVGSTTGNNKPLATATNYNIRYDGAAESDSLTQNGSIFVGDVDGDGYSDLVLGTPYPNSYAGAAYVIFSTLIDDVGVTTGNNKSLLTTTNYNIRYGGLSASELLYVRAVSDVNGDGFDDLVLSSVEDDNNGSNSGSAWVIFSTLIDDVGATTGNNKSLLTATNYNIRYDGAAADDKLPQGGVLTVDINGDGFNDLVVGALSAANNGSGSGSAWVIFSTLIDDVGVTTGNNKPLSTATNYNIRYDGSVAGDGLSASLAGDVNGDGFADLLLDASAADNNGASSGSVYVIFSTAIDDVGVSTGNNKPLSTAGNYNLRYDGAASLDALDSGSVGDLNGDGLSDLVLVASAADNNGASSGSAWVIFSTLIDDVGSTTGNNKPLSTAGNYNLRYDGGAASDQLSLSGMLAIGDINGDGFGDLVLGSSDADNNGDSSGSAWVIPSTLLRAQAPQPQIAIRGGAQIRGKVSFQTHRPFNCGVETVTDADGNVYDTVEIGSQCWMKQNLRVGTMIIGDTNQTNNGTIEKYCYNNDLANCMTNNNPNYPDGGLYQWNEAMQYSTTAGARGICPAGWHIPTNAEWYTLENYLKDEGQSCDPDRSGWGCDTAGAKLKPGGVSAFNANLGGRGYINFFDQRSFYAYFWTSSETSASFSQNRYIGLGSRVGLVANPKGYNFSIRCIEG